MQNYQKSCGSFRLFTLFQRKKLCSQNFFLDDCVVKIVVQNVLELNQKNIVA